MFKKVLATGAMLVAITSAAQAQTIIYSNIDAGSSSGFLYRNTGATAAAPNTSLVADDINFLAGNAGKGVTGFVFSAVTTSATAFTAAPHVRFYAQDPTTGTPTTYLGGVNFAPIAFAANGGGLFNYVSTTGPVFTIPADDFVWAGIYFDAGTGGNATVANLNTLGQLIYDPPTVGASDDVFFKGTGAGPFTSNKPGPDQNFIYFGGSPVASFAWQFSTAAAAAPEPSQYAAFGLGILGVGALALKARRRSSVSA